MQLTKMLDKHSKPSSRVVSVCSFESPVGRLIAASDSEYLYIVCFEDSKNIDKMFRIVADELSCSFKEEESKILNKLQKEFEDYFEGKLKEFSIPIKTFGSEFQKEVWNKLCEQPYGTTRSYGDLAKALGRSASHARAIGAACGANSLFIIIPCHRIVASASKGGFSCGVDRKEWLLKHEKDNLG